MNNYFFRFLCFFAAFSVFAISAETNQSPTTENHPVTKLRWLVAHSPNDYFIKMANFFKEKVERETDKRVVVEVIDETGCFVELFPDWKSRAAVGGLHNYMSHLRSKLRAKGLKETEANMAKALAEETVSGSSAVALKNAEGLKLLQEGKVDIAQSYTYFLAKVANPEYSALELPFLFEGYDHVNKFLESETGERLLASTASSQGYRGLAFTFSGGLLVALTSKNKPLTTEASWKNRRFREVNSTIRSRTLAELGGKFVPAQKYRKVSHSSGAGHRPTNLILAKAIDAEEINLPDVVRWLADFVPVPGKKTPTNSHYDLSKFAVTETQHTLLSTVFLIREPIFQSMSKKDQDIVKSAALAAGKFERELTIQRYEDAKKLLIDSGFAWKSMPTNVRGHLRSTLEPIYTQLFKEVPTTKSIVAEANKLITPIVPQSKVANQ